MIQTEAVVIPIDNENLKGLNTHDIEYILPGVITLLYGNDPTMYNGLVQQHITNFLFEEYTTVTYPSTDAGAMTATIEYYQNLCNTLSMHLTRSINPSTLIELCNRGMVVDAQVTPYAIFIAAELW